MRKTTTRRRYDEAVFEISSAGLLQFGKITPIRFSKAGEVPPTEAKRIIAKALYQREHAQAMEHALSEAVQHFNVCPLCHGLVCNYCFIICDDLDMCRSCTNALQEKGEAVMELTLNEAFV